MSNILLEEIQNLYNECITESHSKGHTLAKGRMLLLKEIQNLMSYCCRTDFTHIVKPTTFYTTYNSFYVPVKRAVVS